MDQRPVREDARRAARENTRSPLSTGLWVFAVGVFAALMIVVAALLVLAPMNAGQRRAARVTNEDLVIQRQAADLRATLVRWQLFLEPRFDDYQNGVSTFAPGDIASGSELAKTQIAQSKKLVSMLRARGIGQVASGLEDASQSLTNAITSLTPIASGKRVSTTRFESIANTERGAYSRVWELASSINQNVSLHTTTPDIDYLADRFWFARVMTMVLASLLVLISLVAGAIFARRATRRHRTQQTDAQRMQYGADMQQALELASTEGGVYAVASRALHEAVPDLDVELLIADSSNAHFRRVLESHTDHEHAEGCGVISPRDCPAATRGHTMQFPSSEALGACPHLEGREGGPCSAVCIPVSIMGSTVGVLHSVGAHNELPTYGELQNLELSARRSAERIALLRAFDKSQTQARTDPLTGLLNRRSLENAVRELQADVVPYAIAYGDLDLFKVLNDTHGHEAGDQALRLFARVLRDAVRPSDLVARYGGEEFVIVLPECGTEAAVTVLERVRERLAHALTSGRVPSFTVSFGVALSAPGVTFAETVAGADRALLNAKTAGRDRVLVADDDAPPEPVPYLPGFAKVAASSTKVRTP